ncbi:unnamed protein product [Bemisia tabaci]|uniref:Uncharacterized protein n=1 Tax=Bemisia tabaci TaxID=7038 RepID=A0A9P0F566_BEMTA|nr:unnamed protein product [Bemisia tabaci]
MLILLNEDTSSVWARIILGVREFQCFQDQCPPPHPFFPCRSKDVYCHDVTVMSGEGESGMRLDERAAGVISGTDPYRELEQYLEKVQAILRQRMPLAHGSLRTFGRKKQPQHVSSFLVPLTEKTDVHVTKSPNHVALKLTENNISTACNVLCAPVRALFNLESLNARSPV